MLCVCGHKKRFNQLFGFCGLKGQLQLKFIIKFKQFMALMRWPRSMCKNGVGNLVAVTWVWQMNKGVGVLPHQQILSLQLRRLCLLITECYLKSWKNSLIFHMTQSGTLFTNVQGTEKCAADGSLDNWQRTTRKIEWVHPSLISSTLMIMVRISWSKSLLGMKLGCTSTVLRQKRNPWHGSIQGLPPSKNSRHQPALGNWWQLCIGTCMVYFCCTLLLLMKQSILLLIKPLSKKIKRAVRRKRPQMADKRALLLHDNARPHTAQATVNL